MRVRVVRGGEVIVASAARGSGARRRARIGAARMMRASTLLTAAAVGIFYAAVVAGHYHAYVHWAEPDADRVVVLHAVSISAHIVSLLLCKFGHPLTGAATIVVANMCHNWLIHVWNTVLATTAYMSRVRLQGVNDLTCTLALSYSAIEGGKLRQPAVLLAVAVLLLVHGSLFLGQALRVPVLDWLVVTFYPETVVREGGPLFSAFNLMRWLAVQSDVVSSSFIMVKVVSQCASHPSAVRGKRL